MIGSLELSLTEMRKTAEATGLREQESTEDIKSEVLSVIQIGGAQAAVIV